MFAKQIFVENFTGQSLRFSHSQIGSRVDELVPVTNLVETAIRSPIYEPAWVRQRAESPEWFKVLFKSSVCPRTMFGWTRFLQKMRSCVCATERTFLDNPPSFGPLAVWIWAVGRRGQTLEVADIECSVVEPIFVLYWRLIYLAGLRVHDLAAWI